SLAFCLSGASQGDDDLYVMANASPEALLFTVQDGNASEWQRVVDTGAESPDDFREPSCTVALDSTRYLVGPQSVVVLVRPRRGSA
ncbi:MAG TPA: glycogen-debranching protein, partial [Candidatus Methylomirabilis sp.]|nr:glycogen-debranching protein [Candidatus Methylomirabilis sp.]